MAKTFTITTSGAGGITQNDALTRFMPITEGRAEPQGAENTAQVSVSGAGTFSRAYVRVIANTHTTANTVYRIRVNGANGNQVITVGAGLTGEFEDVTNTDAISADDEVCWSVVTDANVGTTTTTWTMMSVVFNATTNRLKWFGGGQNSSFAGASTTYYFPFFSFSTNTTENLTQSMIGTSGTLQNMTIYINSNLRTTDTTLRLRKNGANGNQVITIGAGLTGLFEDVTNTDSVVDGDLVNWSFVTGTGTENINLRLVANEMETTGTEFQMIADAVQDVTSGTASTRYMIIAGQMTYLATTESDVQFKMPFDATVKKLKILISGNAANGDFTFTVREDAADTACLITVPTTSTGWKETTTESRAFTAGEMVNMEATNAGSVGSVQIGSYTMVFAEAGGVTYTPTYTEAVVLVDTVTRGVTRTLTEATALVDTVVKTLTRALSETATLVDTFAGLKVTQLILTEIITLVDTISRATTRVFSEAVTLVDTVRRAATRVFNETVTLVDTLTRVWTAVRTYTETVILVDTIAATRVLVRVLTEVVTLVDTFAHAFGVAVVAAGRYIWKAASFIPRSSPYKKKEEDYRE